jgi:uncharacterized membrane protein YphA (DoxX/SURF4 family)
MIAETASLDPLLLLTLRVALALLFATTAAHKLSDADSFRASVRAYRLIPAAAVGLVAALLTAVEAALAIGLVVAATASAAAAGAVVLLALYSIAIAINLARGRTDLDCGCAGPTARQPLVRGLLLRNALLVGCALLAGARGGDRSLVWLDAVSLFGSVACAAALWHAAGRLLALQARSPRQGLGGAAHASEALQ